MPRIATRAGWPRRHGASHYARNIDAGDAQEGLNQLLSYCAESPTRAKTEQFVRGCSVLDDSEGTDEPVDVRYLASTQLEVIASLPLRPFASP